MDLGYRLTTSYLFSVIAATCTLGIVILCLYVILSALKNIYFHPLSRFPGPVSSALSSLPYMLTLARGTLHHDLAYLHDKYGPVVRTTPDSLSFSSGDAWKEIYGHRQAKPNMQKDQRFYAQPLGYPDSIIQANDVEHKRQRKSIAHAFSAKALEEQQGIIGRYIDAFIDGLKTKAQKGEEVDIVAWFNWTTFDIIGDLTFGQNFACLEKQEFHPWIKNIFANIKVVAFGHVCKEYAWLEKLLMVFIPRSMMEKQKEHFDFTQQRVEERLELETSRKDFMTYISRGKGGEKAQDGVTEGEIIVNSAVLVIGGSETTATLLSGIIYYLLQDEECLKKLTKEIREKFDKDEDINFQSVEGLEYLTACLQEGLRCYPPVPIGLPRIVPEGGDEIAGQYVPGGTKVSVSHWSTYHSERNFRDADSYVPERWLGDPKFAMDDKTALQPFSLGPRNCIGKNLANVELRLILSKLLWNFDLERGRGHHKWMNQKIFVLWEKGPLNLKCVLRHHAK